jgi:hypothetical protein
MRLSLIAACLGTLGLTVACGGGGGSTAAVAPPTGTLTLRLGSDSFQGFQHAIVSIQSVDYSLDGGNSWTTMGAVQQTLDLVGASAFADSGATTPMAKGLQGGNNIALFSAFTIKPGTTLTFRINWATTNFSNSTRLPAFVENLAGQDTLLATPASTLVAGTVSVAAGANVAEIMLNGEQAIQYHGSYFAFQGTAQAMNLANSATITGTLTAGGNPIAGAEVFAETVDSQDNASIQRRAFTDASGNYVLDVLPIGGTDYVVSQPTANSISYAAVASASLALPAAQTYPGINLAFTSQPGAGIVNLSLTPASLNPVSIASVNTATIYSVATPFDGTWGELRQTLATGPTFNYLIVRSQTVATGSQDTVSFTGVAATAQPYGITAERSLAGALPTEAYYTSQLTVQPGVTSSPSLGF